MSACGGIQSALDPHGPQARVIAAIGWWMFAGAAAILALVMVLAWYAVYRRHDKRFAPRADLLIASGGVALPVLALSAMLVYGVQAMGNLRAAPPDALTIEVVGNRWWWDVHYRVAGGTVISSANEIHIPAGQAVRINLRTTDVIHSFWVPNLAGKIDLIPGRTNHIVLHADRPGVFRGQCAEFCGAQHARMAFYVIALSQPAFETWLAKQREPARAPIDARAERGRDVFSAHCGACHTVRGLSLASRRGPDLTHLASRRHLGAGTLENNRANLIDFIARSQTIKPGNGMPSQAHLGNDALADIAHYLESLD